MKLRKILTIIAVCTLLTACGSSEDADSSIEVVQDATTEKEDAKEDRKETEENVITINADGELTEDMVSEQLDAAGLSTKEYSVIIGDDVTKIGLSAFWNRDGLLSVTMPEGVTHIGDQAFLRCDNLHTVVLPEGLQVIGGNAYQNCESLETINIPDGVTQIGMDAFAGSGNLVIDRFLCTADVNVNAFDYVTIKEFIYGKDLKLVRPNAFEEANIEKLTFEDGITKIEGNLYLSRRSIVEVVLPEGLEEIGSASFKDYIKLKSVTIPDSVTKIDRDAFTGCIELETLTIPASVTEIHPNAFLECDKLVLSVSAGSAAETFAIENKVPYEVIGQDASERAETATRKEPIEYKELPADAAECVAIEDYLSSRSKAWVVYDIVITDEDEITTISVDIPDRMKGLESDSYIVYAFEGTDFKRRWCEWKGDTVSFLQEGSGVYAVVQYDSNVWSESDFVESSDLIVGEERYVDRVMYTTQETEVLDMPKVGFVIGTLPENQKVEVYSDFDGWVYIYYGDGKGSVPLDSLSDTPK